MLTQTEIKPSLTDLFCERECQYFGGLSPQDILDAIGTQITQNYTAMQAQLRQRLIFDCKDFLSAPQIDLVP